MPYHKHAKQIPRFLLISGDHSLLLQFGANYERLHECLAKVTLRKLQKFSSIKNPQTLEQAIGQAYLLMFSAYEDTEQLIKLTADKRTLAERSWSKAVVKCFSNHGRVMQWLRRMKEHVLDTFKIDSVHLE